ncbi:hypothetical protein QFZ40_000053 [Arthrobacter pascens]|uniref:hypothetical protein n=1 Tax=Arthrobacter pascens TaxID=1677 RepID=UPI00277E36E4|nr:hypothetical protein [Arthrobacter pascens]MDQ0632144.1 hypothetical protein [Arthrobacter pascens]
MTRAPGGIAASPGLSVAEGDAAVAVVARPVSSGWLPVDTVRTPGVVACAGAHVR